MRIQDIIASHVAPGALIIDLTEPADALVPMDWLSPDSGVAYTRDPGASRPAAPAPTVVIHSLPPSKNGQRQLDLKLGEPAPGVIHLVLCIRAEIPMESGLFDVASSGGWELKSTHSIGQPAFPFAFAFAAPEPGDAATTRLRLVNEYRYDKLLLRLRGDHVSRLKRRLAKEKAKREEAEARLTKPAEEQDAESSPTDLEHEREVAGRLRERVLSLDAELAAVRKELAAAKAGGRHGDGVNNDVDGGLFGRWLASLRSTD